MKAKLPATVMALILLIGMVPASALAEEPDTLERAAMETVLDGESESMVDELNQEEELPSEEPDPQFESDRLDETSPAELETADTGEESDTRETDGEPVSTDPDGETANLMDSSGTCGDDLTWVLNDSGTLTISGTGKMTKYSKSPWYSQRTEITSVIIQSGVTTISEQAFYDCTAMTDITIPDSITSIGTNAFSGCKGLTGVFISDIASWCGIGFSGSGANPLYYAKNLYLNGTLVTDLVISGSIAKIGNYAFNGCTSLTSVTLPESISIGEWAFSSCRNLTSLTIPGSVTSIGAYAFSYCSGLTSAGPIGGGYDYEFGWTESIPAHAFDSCTGLTDVKIPDSVTTIDDDAFYYCTSLPAVTIPDSVVSIGKNAFSDCKSLTSITIPDGVTSIGEWAFAFCDGLTGVTVPDSVTSMDQYVFSGCDNLTSAGPIGGGYSYEFGWTETIPKNAFSNCSSLISVTIPGSITDIGSSAFSGCTGLTSAGPIGGGYSYEFGWTEAVPQNAFSGCSSLTSVTIPDGITQIGYSAFYRCTSLPGITIPEGVTSIEGNTFYGCTSLISIIIPDSVQSIGASAFYDCTSLPGVTIPDSVTKIVNNAFYGCTSLTSITIPHSITSVSSKVFYNCSSLTSVTIPVSVTDIQSGAFSGCKSLTDVYYGGSREEWEAVSIARGDTPFDGVTIHYNETVTGDPSSIYDEPTNQLNLFVKENRKAPDNRNDSYQSSDQADVNGTATAKGAVTITDTSDVTVSKDGFATVTRTQEQLSEHSEIYLEPVKNGIPTVTAVWMDGVDIRHFKNKTGLLDTDIITLTADVTWDSTSGKGTVKLIQGSHSATFIDDKLTIALAYEGFDVSEKIYIWAGYDEDHATLKPLKLDVSTTSIVEDLEDFDFSLGDKLSVTIPDSIDFFGGTKMSLGLYSNIPFTIYIEKGKIYAAIGFQIDEEKDKDGWTAKSLSKSVKNLRKSLSKEDSPAKQYQEIQSAMEAFGGVLAKGQGSFGIDAGFSFMGFAEGYFDDTGEIQWVDSGMVVAANAAASYSFPFYIGPVPMFFESSLSGEVTAQLNLAVSNAAKNFTPDGTISGAVKLSAGVGVGLKKVLSASGGMEGSLKPQWDIYTNGKDHFKLTAGLSAYAKVEVLFFSGKKDWKLAESVWIDYPDAADLEEALSPDSHTYDDIHFTLKSEDEMTDHSSFTANQNVSLYASEGNSSTELFADDVYSQARPQLAAFSDGTLLAVWVGLDNSRNTYDRPCLYYSLCSDGVWSNPAVVEADGTPDDSPSLTIVNNVAYLAWSDAGKTMGSEPAMTDAASALNISVAVMNRGDSSWTVSALTADSRMDAMPVICGSSNGIVVAWQSNSANDILGLKGTDTISCAVLSDGVWSSNTDVYTLSGSLLNLDVSMSGGTPAIAWSEQDTNGDTSVWLNGSRQSTGSGATFHGGSLYWYQDGTLYQNGNDTGTAIASDDFQITDNTLLYLSGDGLYSTLMAHYYDTSSGRWSEAVPLSDGTDSLGSFSAASVNGAFKILISSTEVTETMENATEKTDLYGDTSLVLLNETPYCDLSLSEPWYQEDTCATGSTIRFHVNVTNNGTVATSCIVSVTDSAGTVYETMSAQKLLPGCTEEMIVPYIQPDTTLTDELTFTVKAINSTDQDAGNDTVSISLLFEDIAVENIGNSVTEDDMYCVYANIVNRGYTTQKNLTVRLYPDSTENTAVETKTIDTLDSLDSALVLFTVSEPGCYYVAVTGSDTDMNAGNDSDFILCSAEPDSTVTLFSISGRQVEVSLDSAPAGNLMIAAYTKDGQMITSGTTGIQDGTESAIVTLEADLPETYTLKAFILDSENRPLIKSAVLK